MGCDRNRRHKAILEENMHVVIGGGSGFIGTALTEALQRRGDKVTLISRYPGEGRITWEQVSDLSTWISIQRWMILSRSQYRFGMVPAQMSLLGVL